MNKFLITLLTGVGIGILIAPAKGSETRRKLVNRFNDLTEDISEEVSDIHRSGKNLLDEVKNDAQDLVQGFKGITEPA